MLRFCARCNELVGNRHYRSHVQIGYQQMTHDQRRIAAHQLGTKLAHLVQLNPGLIVLAFLSALDDANQREFSKMIERRWTRILMKGGGTNEG